MTRADARTNRRRLLAAAGELLGRGEEFSLAEVAELAGLATATAYRHFHSADDATEAFVAGFWDDFDARVDALDPAADFLQYCRTWVDEVLVWGSALVQIRSRSGFQFRRASRDDRVSRLLRSLEPRIRAEIASLGGDGSRQELSYILGVWNALADPREIIDQHATLGFSSDRIADNLCRTVRAAIRR